MKSDCDVWLSGVILTLESFENVDVLPSKIFLSGGGSHLPEIKETQIKKFRENIHKNKNI